MNKLKQTLKYIILFGVAIWAAILLVNWRVDGVGKPKIYHDIDKIPSAYTVIVLGASVYQNGNLSPILKDRVDSALELYSAGKAKRFLLSGDHGQENYDEVNSMKDYLSERGVPDADIFLDHAGFDTFDSMYRSHYIFEVDSAIVVTQKFHLPRALYIADRLGFNYIGYAADKHQYQSIENLEFRENLANLKAFWEVLIGKEPTYLGNKIPITGDSEASY